MTSEDGQKKGVEMSFEFRKGAFHALLLARNFFEDRSDALRLYNLYKVRGLTLVFNKLIEHLDTFLLEGIAAHIPLSIEDIETVNKDIRKKFQRIKEHNTVKRERLDDLNREDTASADFQGDKNWRPKEERNG